jgi:hypothetical protein
MALRPLLRILPTFLTELRVRGSPTPDVMPVKHGIQRQRLTITFLNSPPFWISNIKLFNKLPNLTSMTEPLSLKPDATLPPDLQQIAQLIEQAATQRQADSLALLALLRTLEQCHREIRETLFRDALPSSRHQLYALLRDIEVSGGWPYIQRMKLQTLCAEVLKGDNSENLPPA